MSKRSNKNILIHLPFFAIVRCMFLIMSFKILNYCYNHGYGYITLSQVQTIMRKYDYNYGHVSDTFKTILLVGRDRASHTPHVLGFRIEEGIILLQAGIIIVIMKLSIVNMQNSKFQDKYVDWTLLHITFVFIMETVQICHSPFI